jgi:hypothetical protein
MTAIVIATISRACRVLKSFVVMTGKALDADMAASARPAQIPAKRLANRKTGYFFILKIKL